MNTTRRIRYAALGLSLLLGIGPAAGACPFCSATAKTLSQEIEAADVTVLAKMVAKPDPDEAAPDLDRSGETEFQILEVIKGDVHLGSRKTFQAIHFGDLDSETTFLITGMVLPDLTWSTPIPLSKPAVAYVGQLLGLPESGADRLAFFQAYLEHDDRLLARDTYDEFARAPYDDLKALKDRMNRDRLVAWIKDINISPSHRRLYLTMLSVCGSQDDVDFLQEMITSDDRSQKAGLDAMIACYLTLRGPDGMPLIEDHFLKNKDAEYADTYSAIMAIRFHGQESDVIPRPRLLEALRYMLDRPELADLVITDLARWEDWSVMDRLVELFKNADESSSWVRIPVINYLQVCGQQDGEIGVQALATIEALAKIDPKAVRQAQSYAAFGGLSQTKQPAVQPTADGPATDGPQGDASIGDVVAPDDPAPAIPANPAAPAAARSPAQTAANPAPDAPAPNESATGASSSAPAPATDGVDSERLSNGSKFVLGLVVCAAFLVVVKLISSAGSNKKSAEPGRSASP